MATVRFHRCCYCESILMKVTENGVFNLRVFSFRVFYVKKNENMVFNRPVATIIKELDMSNGEQCRLAHRNLLINTRKSLRWRM